MVGRGHVAGWPARQWPNPVHLLASAVCERPRLLPPPLDVRPSSTVILRDDHAPFHVLDGIMTLPANDAFTLGLPHDRARIGLRSSKIPFVSSPKARSPSASFRRRESQPRQMSVEIPDAPARSPPPQSQPSHHPSANGSANGAPLRQRKKARTTSASLSSGLATKPNGVAKHRQKVDWEIPRKTLHSSIGMPLFSMLA